MTTTTHLNKTPYVICPVELMGMKDLNGTKLTANIKMVYMIMANDYMFYVKERGFYQPWNKHLAEKTGLTLNTIKSSLKALEECGLIVVLEAKEGFCKKYKVIAVTNAVAKKEEEEEAPQAPVKVKEVKVEQPVIEYTQPVREAPVTAPAPSFNPFSQPTDNDIELELELLMMGNVEDAPF